jgi:hypothetical protein
LPDNSIGLLYGKGGTNAWFPDHVSFARFNLEWLIDGQESQCNAIPPTQLAVANGQITWNPGTNILPQYVRIGSDLNTVKTGCPDGTGDGTGCHTKSEALPATSSSYPLPGDLSRNTNYYIRVANAVDRCMAENIISYQVPSIRGDANGDGIVNTSDLQILADSFGKSSGQTGYYTNADFNSDNTVNILDFQISAKNYGR